MSESVIVGLGRGLQLPRWTFSDIFLRKDIKGSWKTFVSLLLINLLGGRGLVKVSGNISWTLSHP